MRTVAFILVAVGLLVAAVLAPNLDVQASGAAACLLAAGVGASALAGMRNGRRGGWLLWLAVLTAAWFGWLALHAPVADLGRADGILILGGLLAFLWAAVLASKRSLSGAFVLLSVIAVVSVAIGAVQATSHPEWNVLGGVRATPRYASGFYGHYNHFANFLLGMLFPTLGLALLGKRGRLARLAWLLVALSAVAGVLLAQSRGAFVGLAAGSAVFVVFCLIDWRRRFRIPVGPLVLAAVVVLPVLAGGGLWVARKALAQRQFGGASALDNDCGRLEFAVMALDISSAKPLSGSGSRSFAYEGLRHWDPNELWTGSADINFVHNEFLQAASDYGWPAFGLIVLLLAAVLFKGLAAVWFDPADRTTPAADPALTAGALAGLVAMATQANFSFVFHLLPDVILAGILLGVVAGQPWPLAGRHKPGARLPLPAVLALLVAAASLAWFWRDAAAVRTLLGGGSLEQRLESAAEVRPDFQLFRRLGDLRLSHNEGSDVVAMNRSFEQAVDAYGAAVKRHPFEVETIVNYAKVCDRLGRYEEAEPLYQKVIPLADPRESYYRTRFYHGRHAYLRGLDALQRQDGEAAMGWFTLARERIGESRKLRNFAPDSTEGRLLATVDELLARGHFTRGHQLYLQGRETWYARKPEQALRLLLDARGAMQTSREILPFDKNPEAAGILKDVEALIELLEGAGIRPAG